MSSQRPKGGPSSIRNENEVETKREAGDWKRVLELLEPTKFKGTSSADPLMNFLYGEAKLEAWLEEHQPTEKFISKAKAALVDTKKCILLALNQAGDQSGLRTDAHILLAKIFFASGLYEEVLDELVKSNFEQIDSVINTVRNLQLMAEAYAIKGYSVEKVGRLRTNQYKSEEERHTEILRCYSRAADLALAYFQGQERVLASMNPSVVVGNSSTAPVNVTASSLTSTSSSSHLPSLLHGAVPPGGSTKDKDKDKDGSNTTTSISPHPPQSTEKRRTSSVLEHAIRRIPAILLDRGESEQALTKVRWLLRSQETQLFAPIRLILSRRLAEVLLRSYWTVSTTPPSDSLTRVKYYTGNKIFQPQNGWEDIFLVLLLSESMVVRDGVLNQSPEFAKARKLANMNAASIFDLLAIAAGRWGCYHLINESLEKSLKFSFEEPHIWAQYALTFHACGMATRKSVKALEEAARLSKRPSSLLLMAAQEQFLMMKIAAGLKFVETAKLKEQEGQQKLLQRCFLYEGIGLFLQTFEKMLHQQRMTQLEEALQAFQAAVDLDNMDYISLHWLSRTNAFLGNVNEAFTCAVQALRAYPFHLPTLQLIILLLSAQRNYGDALAVAEESLDEYPDHLGLLQLKGALEDQLVGPEGALGTLKQMLIIWKNLLDDSVTSGVLRSESPDCRYPTFGGTLQLPSPTDKESVSMASYRAPSIAGSSTLTAGMKADSALSEIASSLSVHGSVAFSTSGDLAWNAQITIWLTLTDLYLKMDLTSQAVSSLEEANQICSIHPDVVYFRGRVAENQEDYHVARKEYESAVAIRPTHVKALQRLALMQHYFGSHRLAEKTLQDALKLDPYDHHTWYNLGKVLEALDECDEAGDCMATALEIESTMPILPYSVIPICFD